MMRIELIIFIIASIVIANIYTDGKVLKKLYSWKKYYQMIGVAFGALILYYLFKRHPDRAKNIIMSSNEYLKYAPIDRNTSAFLSPILDFTSKQSYSGDGESGGYAYPIMAMPRPEEKYEQRIMNSGKKGTKRSVSETKKKYVASIQDWKCGHCNNKLTHTFEVDHKVRLEHGGGNDPSNLVALCRECHGQKTASENM